MGQEMTNRISKTSHPTGTYPVPPFLCLLPSPSNFSTIARSAERQALTRHAGEFQIQPEILV
jgi:hypothetical protein